ncbi:hypothetical protein L6164_008288 [Bauhinia variegata]|uniref:Uncharacterized protein n=1 Tax=Bauhinia variegata TaxID=167791 RepID=A0ACB9PJ31_BAUVA|nr:hypothetical protein L6164_008288 [Bauhinia variegata]
MSPMISISRSNFFCGLTIAFSLCFLYTLNYPNTTQSSSKNSPIDPYKKLHIILNPNATITRLIQTPHVPPSSHPNLPIPVLSKDVTINQSKNTWVRVFLPRNALNHTSSRRRLPLVVFFHGGGFILLSAATRIFHQFCVNMANDIEAVVVSVEYRLAPENRLPEAYDDAMEALHWIRISQQEEDWLARYADYSNCFLMGSSAGGNIAYHAGLRAAAEADHLLPLKIAGLILVQPFFGGVRMTASELRLLNDRALPLSVAYLMWNLSLPVGVDRDHEYCNPMAGNGPKQLDNIRQLGWQVLVTGCDGDPLVDRQIEVVRLMLEKDLQVVGSFDVGDYHGIQDREPLKAKQVYGVIKNFMSSMSA